MSALCSDVRKKIYIGAHLQSRRQTIVVEFFSKLSAICTKWCAQSFPPIFGLFAIFDRNFEKIVAPPSNECENYVACLKDQSLPKKDPNRVEIDLQTATQCVFELCTPRMHGAPDSERDKKTPHFRTYSRRALYDLSQTLHGDRARRAHQKRCINFLIQRIVFPTVCTEKFGLIYRRAVSQQ